MKNELSDFYLDDFILCRYYIIHCTIAHNRVKRCE